MTFEYPEGATPLDPDEIDGLNGCADVIDHSRPILADHGQPAKNDHGKKLNLTKLHYKTRPSPKWSLCSGIG